MDNPRQSILPPMPPSDPKSLEWNRFDSFYKYKSRDFWGDAEIIQEEPKPFQKCEHNFFATPQGVECKKCHFGLVGVFEISNGQLFYKGEAIGI